MSLMRRRNPNDDVCGADNELCREAFIKAVIGYAESRFRHRLEVVNDQSEHRCEDSGDPCNGSQNKMDSGRLIERLKRGV